MYAQIVKAWVLVIILVPKAWLSALNWVGNLVSNYNDYVVNIGMELDIARISVCLCTEAASDARYEEGNERESHNYRSKNPAFNAAINKWILYQEAL